MSRMHFIHGSSATPESPGDFQLGLMDYQQGHDGKNSHRGLGNGEDAYGPGIYAFPVKDTHDASGIESIKSDAYGYMGPDGLGSVFGLSMDSEDEYDEPLVPANTLPPDMIPAEEWAEVIDYVAEERRRLEGYFRDDFDANLHALKEEWARTGEPPSSMALAELVTDAGGMPVNEINPDEHIATPFGMSEEDKKNYKPHEAWFEYVEAHADGYDPGSRIDMQGGAHGIAENAIRCSDNLWSVLCYIQGVAAYEPTGRSANTFNKTLHYGVMNYLSNPELLSYAEVNDGAFCVIFDTDALRVDYASQTLSDIDIPQLDALLDDIKDIYRGYGYDMSPAQLGVKFEQAAQTHFGISLSDDIQTQLQRGRSPESMYSQIARDLVNEISPVYVKEWSRNDEAAQRFQQQPDSPKAPDPVEMEPHRELELSTPALRPR